ncbi:MAG TPA: hypothetical protein ENN80_10860, partial [Candidatus Hydrogenedentes bacterium]|nr:hypothetical protein [Candidatus Hydrogenedentota bacterium]
MGEQTPDRLREFRSQYRAKAAPGLKLLVLLVVLTLAGFGGVFGLLLRGVTTKPESQARHSIAGAGLPAQTERDYAAYLAEREQPLAAIEAYQRYLTKASLDPNARANICYTMAKLAIKAEAYDVALTFLYQAEFLAPESELKDEIDKKVVLCLDKLGRRVDLRKELRKRTRLQRTAEDLEEGETVLAEFAGEIITDRDWALELEKLPAYMRDSVTTIDKKTEFLKNMVAQRLLVDKARRLELDQDPDVQERVARHLDAMIVQKLIEDEVASAVRVTPEDVERFYKAETERFTEPAKAVVRVGEADTAEAVQAFDVLPEATRTVRKGGAVPGVPGSE